MSSTETPMVEKSQFRNMTDGWVGAVVIGPRGDDRGVGVEPGGTVWLSKPEQILTANAPRKPEDNPFIEQTRTITDPQTGETEEVKVTPLVPIQENRFVPSSHRPIPAAHVGAADAAMAAEAARGDEPVQVVADEPDALKRHAEVEQIGEDAKPNQQPPVPRAAAAAVAAAAAEAEADSTEPSPTQDAPPPTEEERATEETGAALAPSGEPPQGEYAAREEVGTPDAAQAGPPAPAAPHSPGSDASMAPPPYTAPTEG